MALPELEHYLYRLKMAPAMQQAFLADRQRHLAGEALSAAERDAMLQGDLETLWRMGVHPMLMAPLGRMFGLGPAEYRARMRPLAGERMLKSSP
jgi:hypothetical protein